MTTAVCMTEGCPEEGIAKAMGVALLPGETVLCGECREPCQVGEGVGEPREQVEAKRGRREPRYQ